MKIKALKSFMLLIFGALLLGQLQEIFPQKIPLAPALTGSSPTLYTEKSVYEFGENVVIRGVNFEPFEAVPLTIRRTDAEALILLNDGVSAEWIVFADEKGDLETTWTVNYPGSRFEAEAGGIDSKRRAVVEFIIFAPSVNLDQCRNGTADAPNDCAGTNWVNGDLNASQAHYTEGESVPYRLILSNLSLGLHNVTIEYDTTEGAKHAIDYLTTYNRSELTAAPCDGICNPSPSSTRAFPLDPEVAKGFDGVLGTPDDVTQIPGNMTLFGGNITGISGYTMTGSYGGSSQTRLTINFTATSATVVLAWGGHIATRQNWGQNNSAVAISGAPFHMRVYDVDGEGAGNQDRSLQSGAVYYPGRISIVKDAQPDSVVPFDFSAVGPAVSNFTIDDDGDTTNTYSNTKVFDGLTNFGAGHTVTVTETSGGGYWALTQLTCTSNPNGGTGTNNNNISLPAKTVEVFLEEGEFVTCTFVNSVITAASVSINGLILDASGRGIPRARVTLTHTASAASVQAITNPFGRYVFEDVSVGEAYVISVTAKGYAFAVPSMIVTPMDNMSDVNFEALPD